jgi:hypothetical protein
MVRQPATDHRRIVRRDRKFHRNPPHAPSKSCENAFSKKKSCDGFSHGIGPKFVVIRRMRSPYRENEDFDHVFDSHSTLVQHLFTDCPRRFPLLTSWHRLKKPPFGALIATSESQDVRQYLQEGFIAMNQSEVFLSSLLIAVESTIDSQPVDAPVVHRPSRLVATDRRTPAPSEEALVVDERSGLRPAHVVESKLTRLLKEASLPASHLQMRGLLRSR